MAGTNNFGFQGGSSGGGGGGVSGSGASPQITFWTGTTTIGGSNLFQYATTVYTNQFGLSIGTGVAPTQVLDIAGVVNTPYFVQIKNSSPGAAAMVGYTAVNNSGDVINVDLFSSGFTTSGLNMPRSGHIGCNAPNGLVLLNYGTNGPVIMATGGQTIVNTVLWASGVSQKVAIGRGVTATPGSGYLQISAGTQLNQLAQAGGTLYSYTSLQTATSPETALYSSKIWGNTLVNVGDSLVAEYTVNSNSDNMLAVNSLLSTPSGLVVDASGNVYIADTGNNRIRFVNIGTGIITTFAGKDTAGYSGDGNLAINAQLNAPEDVCLNPAGTILYIADSSNNVIRAVTISTGVIATFAGNGTSGFSGDTGPATSAELANPNGVATDSTGNLYIADTKNDCIRIVNTSNVINTFAGQGTVSGNTGDGGAATSATLNAPQGVGTDSSGNVYIADTGNNRIRYVSGGNINNFAGQGNGASGFGGNGGSAVGVLCFLNGPQDVCADTNGNVYIADTGNQCIRVVNSHVINEFSGQGTVPGNTGDGGAATSATLLTPQGVASGSGVNPIVYIGDSGNGRVRNNTFISGYVINNFAGNINLLEGYYFSAIANLYFGVTGSSFGGTGDASITNGIGGITISGVFTITLTATLVTSALLKITYVATPIVAPGGGDISGDYVLISYTNSAALNLASNNFLTLTGIATPSTHVPAPQINAVMGNVQWVSGQ